MTVGFLDSPSEIVVSEDVEDILLEVGVLSSGVFTFDITVQITTLPLLATGIYITKLHYACVSITNNKLY